MTPTTIRQRTSAEVADDLRTVMGRLVRRLRADYTIAPHQYSVLNRIERGGAQTTSGLATAEFVRPQSMAHTVQQLDDAGFVTRQADPSDGRQTLIGLSDAGRAAVDSVRRQTSAWLAAVIDRELDGDEQQVLAAAVDLLGRIVES